MSGGGGGGDSDGGPYQGVHYFPLSNAYLCEDCHCVGNVAERCPACASEALMGLAGVLNRGEGRTEERVGEGK
jgi:hypothetical protein